MQNAYLQSTITKLLDEKLSKPVDVHATRENLPIAGQIRLPWTAQRQKLEAESRKQADELLRKKNEELEKELTSSQVGKVNAL